MAKENHAVAEAFQEGRTLAVADQVLIDPRPGILLSRVDTLLEAIRKYGRSPEQICETLVRLGMNFVGRDAEIVGYKAVEIDSALSRVLSEVDSLDRAVMKKVVSGFLADMKSVNLGDSLTGLLAERIEPGLDINNPGRSFLMLLKKYMRDGIYWRMIGESYSKFGNDFARGLEYLRHYGFCQVSTNPVLAARAFDEDPTLTDELKEEIKKHDDWKKDPEAHADEIAMAATLIALWPNLAVFRPLALYTGLKDYMVSFQLNPNIADQADASIDDALNAHRLAANFLKNYDSLLGLADRAGKLGPCIVFKVAGGHEAARKITVVLNSNGIGTNNTVVYTVAQEVQLVLDAFEGKAKAVKDGRPVVRTYETNMGGRFVSHLREIEAEKIFLAVADKSGDEKASRLLDDLASSLRVDKATLDRVAYATVAVKSQAICSFKYLKTLDNPVVIQAAGLMGQSTDAVKVLEEDLKKAGTLVARRVHWVFYSAENRPKWISYLTKKYGVTADQAQWILNSMDVLPASKRVPEDTLHALAGANMCHTEFPNHSRAVQLASEKEGFRLEDLKESVSHSYEPGVVQRLSRLEDFRRGYDLTRSLKDFLQKEVGVDVGNWQTEGLKPEDWPEFGSVQKTTAEFKAAYDTFAIKCIAIAREVAAG